MGTLCHYLPRSYQHAQACGLKVIKLHSIHVVMVDKACPHVEEPSVMAFFIAPKQLAKLAARMILAVLV